VQFLKAQNVSAKQKQYHRNNFLHETYIYNLTISNLLCSKNKNPYFEFDLIAKCYMQQINA
jgi:hypothetical protein